jgi:hypothetical protein
LLHQRAIAFQYKLARRCNGLSVSASGVAKSFAAVELWRSRWARPCLSEQRLKEGKPLVITHPTPHRITSQADPLLKLESTLNDPFGGCHCSVIILNSAENQ